MLEKLPSPELPPAKTPHAAAVYLRRLGIVLSMIATIDANEEKEHQAVTQRYAQKRQRQLEKAISLARPLREYADSSGALLTIRHAGKLEFIRRPSVMVRDAAKAITAIKRRGKALARRLLRVKIEINKQAIHADPESVKGIRSLHIEHSDVLKIKPEESAYAIEYDRKNAEYALSRPRKRDQAEAEQ